MNKWMPFFALILFAGLCMHFMLGFFGRIINYDKGAWWPNMNLGVDKLQVWRNGDIIYSDRWDFHLTDRDSLYKDHLAKANEFK